MHIISYEIASGVPKQNWDIRYQVQKTTSRQKMVAKITISVKSENLVSRVCGNLLTAITSRVATLISASSKVHVTIEYHVMCLVLCMYSTLYSVQYGEILLS